MRFLVARRESPDRPLVAVRVERRFLFWWRVTIEPLGPGESGVVANIVDLQLHETPLALGARSLQPPHTRSPSRVETALRQLVERSPVFVTWVEGQRPAL